MNAEPMNTVPMNFSYSFSYASFLCMINLSDMQDPIYSPKGFEYNNM